MLSSPAYWWRRKIPWNLFGSKPIMVYSYSWEEPNWYGETSFPDAK